MRKTHSYLKTSLLSLLSVILLGFGLAPMASAETPPSVYLSPSTKTVQDGQSFDVKVYADSGSQNMDTVNVVVAYNASDLTYNSHTESGSVFTEFPGTYSASSGSVQFVVSKSGTPATGNQYVATLNFTAQVNTGSATIDMTGSDLAYAGNSLSATPSGATINFTNTTDTTDPTVSITSPSNKATVSGTTTVKATASDNVGVTKVVFYVDGSQKHTDSSSSYTYSLDTTTLSDGSHTLKATAYDAAGNTRSQSITFSVDNGGGAKAAGSTTPKTPKTPDTGFAFTNSKSYLIAAVALLALAGVAVGVGRVSRKFSR